MSACSWLGNGLFQAGMSALFLAGEWIISGRYECIVPGWGMDYFRPV
jgi:hypothetical protein